MAHLRTFWKEKRTEDWRFKLRYAGSIKRQDSSGTSLYHAGPGWDVRDDSVGEPDESYENNNDYGNTGERNGRGLFRQMQTSAAAYQDINRMLDSFYEVPKEDPEREKRHTKLMEIGRQMNKQQTPTATTNAQMTLLYKSYQLAVKYMASAVSTKS